MQEFTNILLYERIKALCIKKGVTINKMLTECCINSSFMQDLKSKNVRPSVEKILRIALYFEVSTDYLLGLTDTPTPVDKITPLTERQGEAILHMTLKDSGLIGPDGQFTPEGAEIVAKFIKSNAEMLKKLLKE